MTSRLNSRPFYTSLSCGALRIDVDFETSVDLALEFGFEGVSPDDSYLMQLSGVEREALRRRLVADGLRWGSVGIRVNLEASAADYERQLGELDAWSDVMASVGVERTHTWIVPTSDEMTYSSNFARHVERISAVSKMLASRGLRLGIEYVGQKRSWSRGRFPFVHSLAEARELIDAVGDSNVGVVLDSLHWYSADESVEDLAALTANQVVAVDINDARPNVGRNAHPELERALPGATGVIDISEFLGVLHRIRFDGPLRVESIDCFELEGRSVREKMLMVHQALNSVL